jgi:predicted O-methyltransferase YrrM
LPYTGAVDFVLGDFKNILPKLQQEKWDLIFFDGNHSKIATLSYMEVLLPSITNETIWVFDDIHWSKDMEAAWEAIKNHPKVTVSLDLFCIGLVFFRTEQAKEHFVIMP